MENELFLNPTTGLPPSQLHSASISTWHTSSSPPIEDDIPTSHHHQPSFIDRSDCLFDSNLSSSSNTNFIMGNLIGKLGNICDGTNSFSDDICDPSPYIIPSNNNSSLNSPPPPPKSNVPMMDCLPLIINNGRTNPMTNFPNMNLPNSNSMPVTATVNLPAMPGDPGFAERAARFSSFGSRSFNGRNSNHHNNGQPPISNFLTNNGISPSPRGGKLQRVLSSPALQLQQQQQSQQGGTRFSDNSRENSSGSGGENNINSRKRKSITKPNHIPSPSSTKMEKGGGGGENCPYSKRSKPCNEEVMKTEEENREDGGSKKQRQLVSSEEVPKQQDYIHVRARRGQATDSHSLAERVRREKISERMKLLQDLVPGCNKVIGKALMLEEIINYVQSLQRQVEFLSMKLASVNTRMEDQHPYQNDMFEPNCSMPHQQQQQQQSRMSSSSTTKCTMEMDHHHQNHHHGGDDIASLQTQQSHLLGAISDSVLELQSLCESDLQTIVQMGLFNRRDHQPQSQSQSQSIDRVN